MSAALLPESSHCADAREGSLQELASTISSSRLNCFLTCRLKFFFRYVLQLTKPSTSALVVGKAVHGLLQAWNIARWRGLPQQPLHESLEPVWSDPDIQSGIVWKGEEENLKKALTLTLVDAYLMETPIPVAEKPEAVEAFLEADLATQNTPRLVGILDLVRPGGLIVDFKTCSQSPSSDRSAHQYEIQLTAYAILYRAATGRRESGFELHHLIKSKTPKTAIVAVGSITPRQEQRFYRTVESYQEGLARRDFVPSPGMACFSCEYFGECRAWSGHKARRVTT